VVFLASQLEGQSLIDRLYLPSPGLRFASGTQKAKDLAGKVRDETGLAKDVALSNQWSHPVWFVADEVYSQDASFWRWLEQEVNSPTSLTVNKRQPPINFQTCYAEDLARAVNSNDWHRLSAGQGTKGERYYDWACVVSWFSSSRRIQPLVSFPPLPRTSQ